MIKGIQRQMVVVNTSESQLFETAYFVLRKDATQKSNSDMVAEANRLVAASEGHKKGAHKHKKVAIFSFICGIFTGALIGAFVSLLFCLL